MLSFLLSPFGKIIEVGMIFLTLVSSYYLWKSHIENLALAKFNQQQIEQTIKDQQEYNEKLKEIDKIQQDIIDKNKTNNDNLQNIVDSLNKKIDSLSSNKEPKSSSILKETVKHLGDIQ